jgi:hypothetical protein
MICFIVISEVNEGNLDVLKLNFKTFHQVGEHVWEAEVKMHADSAASPPSPAALLMRLFPMCQTLKPAAHSQA